MVQINGEPIDAAGKNLQKYLTETGYNPAHVAVERNLEILPRDTWDQVTIADGDTIEILQFMGGG